MSKQNKHMILSIKQQTNNSRGVTHLALVNTDNKLKLLRFFFPPELLQEVELKLVSAQAEGGRNWHVGYMLV